MPPSFGAERVLLRKRVSHTLNSSYRWDTEMNGSKRELEYFVVFFLYFHISFYTSIYCLFKYIPRFSTEL